MENGGESVVAGTGALVIASDVPVTPDQIETAFRQQNPEMAQMVDWTRSIRSRGLFDRDTYVLPRHYVDELRTAEFAVNNDDIVGGVIDTTEALALSKISIEGATLDESDILNQVAAELNLDARIREMWRELSTFSTVTVGIWWTTKRYTVSGRGQARSRRKTYSLRVPGGLTIFDPTRVAPVGSSMFNQESLVYLTQDINETKELEALLQPGSGDNVIPKMFEKRYELTPKDKKDLQAAGFKFNAAFKFRPEAAFRHTLTRPQYSKFASVRMKSCFELLDLKHLLRASDRAMLLGNTNFIVLVRKGTDDHPAQPSEIANLQAQVRTVAASPILVGDHRLSVEIVTPKQDLTLNAEKYSVVDLRLTSRLLQTFMADSKNRGDDPIKVAKVVARGLESRRHMLRRDIEKNIFEPMYDKSDALTSIPKLRFHPKRISLDFDAQIAALLGELRDRGELSRETILEELDFSQATEARRRMNEKQNFDEIFNTIVPYNAPGVSPTNNTGDSVDTNIGANVSPRAGGARRGGSRGGGGRPEGS